jgi:hypothetical protein
MATRDQLHVAGPCGARRACGSAGGRHSSRAVSAGRPIGTWSPQSCDQITRRARQRARRRERHLVSWRAQTAPNDAMPTHSPRTDRHVRGLRGTRRSRGLAYDEGRPCSGRSQIRCDELLDPSATSSASTSLPFSSAGSIASRSTTALTPACRALSTRPARVSMESRSRCPTGRNTTRSRSIRTLIAGSASASLSRHTISPALRCPESACPILHPSR